jgi:GT2 family glycosyltransferase
MARLTVVIPTWETADLTIKCVSALRDDGVPDSRVVVVDNGSRDSTYERLVSALPGCKVVRLDENVGYAGAANEGVAALPGDAYLVLNNDAFVHRKGSVAALVEALDDDRVGVVVPRVLNEDLTLQRTVAPTHRPGSALARSSGLSRFIPDRFQPHWGTHWGHDESREIEGADGPVVLVRSSAWDALRGFDTSIYMYAEDLDLCWRARRLGWTIWFERASEFVHLGNRSSGRHWGEPKRAEMIGRSEGHMIRRHLPRLSGGATIAVIAAGVAARSVVFALARDRKAAAALRAYLSGLLRG